MIRFLCGCTSKLEIPCPDRRLLATFDGVSVDAEGFIQCSLHHQRRYGWRSPSVGQHTGLNDIEYERLIVWGLPTIRPAIEIRESAQPDLRPHIYEGMLDERALEAIAASRNGGHHRNGSGDSSGVSGLKITYHERGSYGDIAP